jgi:phosphoribosylformylglycinamidine cyclo-ligase
MAKSEYAQAGVDYEKIEPFKRHMIEVGKKTLTFPNRRGVYINQDVLHAHGAVYEYRKKMPEHFWQIHKWPGYFFRRSPIFCNTQEGLGNKNWIAEWMYQHAGTGRTYYEDIGIDVALMAVNDLIAQGAMPVIYTDEVAAGDSDWFTDDARSAALAQGFFEVCQLVGMALPAGESPSLRYLIRAEPPVTSAPSLSGCATGIITKRDHLITGEKLQVDDIILGAPSSGLHANGVSLVIKKALALPDKFLTRLPNGNTLGEEALIPTRSYVALVEALLENEVDIHALLPSTGDGVGKLAFDDRPYTYRIHSWVKEVPLLFQFMHELGVSLEDCLKTFNWGIGYYIFVPPSEVKRVMDLGSKAGYEMYELGRVEDGERKTIFEPGDITLPPPGQ